MIKEDICPRCGKPIDLTKLHVFDRKKGDKIHIGCEKKNDHTTFAGQRRGTRPLE